MLRMEDILSELEREEMSNIEQGGGLPPGFRFHPTDEELITFYLASKVFNGTFCGIEIAEVDLNRCEPWELPDVAKMGEREWYFFSLRDRKYPTGLRTNRATGAGYWKATGKDRGVYTSTSCGADAQLIGMKKTLVFYKGRAPRGHKTKWVMHEYRLDGHFSCRHTCKEEWVICRIYHKIGEKKIPSLFQGQSYFIPTSNSLPPLLEPPQLLFDTQPHHQNPQTIQTLNPNFHVQTQESDLKTLINPLISQSDLFSANNFPNNPISSFAPTNKADSISFFKPFLPDQDFSTFKELNNVITKQCKKETTSEPHFGLISDGFNVNNMQWGDHERINQENCSKYDQNNSLLLSGLDCGSHMGNIPSAATSLGVGKNNNFNNYNSNITTTAAIEHLMSTEPAYAWW